MSQLPGEPHPLPYAAPTTRARGSAALIIVIVLNSMAALGSLLLVPLAAHIYSCNESQKWCHVQALLFGVPSALVFVLLLVPTTVLTIGDDAAAIHPKARRIAAWLTIGFAFAVLAALFIALIINSWGSRT